MINLKDYNIKDGVATLKKKSEKKPIIKAKVITKDDYNEKEA